MQRPAISPPVRNGSQVPRFTLADDEEVQHLAPGPSSHKPQARFPSSQQPRRQNPNLRHLITSFNTSL